MGGLADEQAVGELDVALFEALDFLDESEWVDDDAVGDDALFPRAQDAGGDEVKDEFLLADFDRMSGIVAALGADDDIGFLGEDVDDFSFSFIAPLGAD